MINFKKESDAVFYSKDIIPKVSKLELDFLLNQAKKNKKKTSRLCTHQNIQDKSHEMFIVHLFDFYGRPHKHISKNESMSVIEGEADAFFFNEKGDIIDRIELGEYTSGKNFYYRIDKGIYHCLLIRSSHFIFQENTLGPFNKKDMVYPEWSSEVLDNDFQEKLKNY